MFTLPRFEERAAIALLWGDRWWLEGRDEPVNVGDGTDAADVLLAVFGDSKPARLRLIYQPSSLVSIAAACPMAGRSAIREALQEEHPALGQADCAWGYEPMALGPQTGATLLHYEREPRLRAVVAALHRAGVAVEGAWPLASALNLVPDDWPDTGALTVIAVADRQAFVYRHTPSGQREAQFIFGDGAEALATHAAHDATQRNDTALHLVGLDVAGTRLAETLATTEASGRNIAGWSRVVEAARTLAPHQPNQMLAASAWWTGERTVQTLTAVFAFAACVLACEQVIRWRTGSRQAAAETSELANLQRELAPLRARESEAHRLREEIARFRPGLVACGALLRALPRDLPPQAVITRIRADKAGFTIEGGVAGDALVAANWRAWLAQLQANTHPWRIAEAAVPVRTFALKGQWR